VRSGGVGAFTADNFPVFDYMRPNVFVVADSNHGFDYAFDCGSGYGPFTPSNSTSCPTSTSGTLNVGGIIQFLVAVALAALGITLFASTERGRTAIEH